MTSSVLTRREILRVALGASMASLANTSGCRPNRGVPDGELLDMGGAHAHRWLREGLADGAPSLKQVDFARAPSQSTSVIIIGAGIAGLSAAWRLRHAGLGDVRIVELDELPGGTAQSSASAVTPFPWGAHYVVAPDRSFPAFERLLRELGAFDGEDAEGRPRVAEAAACREPEERHFHQGRFYPGLYPFHGETAAERGQRERFARTLAELTTRTDGTGHPWFALPQTLASRSAPLLALDRQPFSAWLDANGFDSWRLRWLCNYACRDDYGCTLETTSARAGLLYFCARRDPSAARDDLDGGRTVITWPEGNGRIVAHLLEHSGAELQCRRAAVQVALEPDGLVRVDTLGVDGPLRLRAPHVVVAVPGFVAERIVPELAPKAQRAVRPSTSPWVVVNLHLSRRPNDRDKRYPSAMPWDTVFTESESLGYVVATHQTGRDHGATVLTWYRPFTDADPLRARRKLQGLSREHWAEAALSELELAHPDIRRVVTRVDVARFGHAMIRPTPGLWAAGDGLQSAPLHGRIHLAHTDLSGVALCEEAFAHGVRAAEAILRERNMLNEAWL
jgi:phytoene dehydrogenase-like protein